MKYLFSIHLFLSALLLSAQPTPHAILERPRVFSFQDVQRELFGLRKATVEHIVVYGDNTPAGDQRIVDTLRLFLAPRIFSADGQHSWKKFSRKVKRLTVRNANWTQVPAELGEFNHLAEVLFVNCPNLNLQTLNDQVKALNKESNLYEKFHEEIISLTFERAEWQVNTGFALEPELFGDLRELRLISIGNFHACCPSLLAELQRCCSTLGWLTLESCQLDNTLPLDTLRAFSKLQALSLRSNRLTRVPALPTGLRSLDVSLNLISEFIEKTPDDPLRMLYMDCNLFNSLTMTDLYARDLYPNLEVLTYECNNLTDTVLEKTTHALDQRRVASFMSYAPRYVNDFKPDPVACERCLAYRWGVAKALLEGVSFLVPASGTAQIMFGKNGDKIMVKHSDGMATTYEFVQFSKSERTASGDWVFTIEVTEALNLKGASKHLIVTRNGNGVAAGSLQME